MIDSALGVGVRPGPEFEKRVTELEKFMSDLRAPKFPFPIDSARAAAGEQIYSVRCAECHAVERRAHEPRGPIDEIGTDRARFDTWTQNAADRFNAVMKEKGFERPGVVKSDGYLSPPLDGIWMRAPYLHNGSVPTLRDLLNVPAERPATFHRGYDVFDPAKVGWQEPARRLRHHQPKRTRGSSFSTRAGAATATADISTARSSRRRKRRASSSS